MTNFGSEFNLSHNPGGIWKFKIDNFYFRIVIVSSIAHRFYAPKNGINFEDINWEKSFDSRQAYGQSKLANVLHAKELAKRLEKSGILVYSLHPGTRVWGEKKCTHVFVL